MLFFLVLTGFKLSAQEFKKYWSDEKLKLSDFTGSPVGSTPFQIKYDIVYSKKKQKIEKTLHSHYETKAIFLPAESWIVADSLQNSRLRYCNVIFDFAELYARRLNDEINVTNSFDNSTKETVRALNDAVAMVANDTKLGTDRQRVAFWEAHIDSVLKITYRKDIPDFKYDRLTIGYYWGATHNYLTGNLGNQFSSPFSVCNGVFLSWKRVVYAGQASFLGKSTVSKSYYDQKYEFGDTAVFSMSYSNLSVGYEIIKKPQFLLAPYVGMSTMRMTMRNPNPSGESIPGPLRAAFNAGLGMDFRSKAFFQNNNSQFRYGLCVRANYSPYNYLPKLKGDCFSFTLGISVYLDAVKNYL